MPTDPDLPRRLRWAAARVEMIRENAAWSVTDTGFFVDITKGTPSGLPATAEMVFRTDGSKIWSGLAYTDHVVEVRDALERATSSRRALEILAEDLRTHAFSVERQLETERLALDNPFTPFF